MTCTKKNRNPPNNFPSICRKKTQIALKLGRSVGVDAPNGRRNCSLINIILKLLRSQPASGFLILRDPSEAGTERLNTKQENTTRSRVVQETHVQSLLAKLESLI